MTFDMEDFKKQRGSISQIIDLVPHCIFVSDGMEWTLTNYLKADRVHLLLNLDRCFGIKLEDKFVRSTSISGPVQPLDKVEVSAPSSNPAELNVRPRVPAGRD